GVTVDQTQVAAASGALADTTLAPPAAVVPVDTQPTQAAPAAVTPTESTATPSAKLVVAALKPIRVGDSATLRARVTGDTAAKAAAITWSSSAPLIARIDSRTGRIVAVKEGSATITATAKGVTGRTVVRVVPGANVTLAGHVPVSSLITNEIKGALHPGDTTRLTAAPLGPNG